MMIAQMAKSTALVTHTRICLQKGFTVICSELTETRTVVFPQSKLETGFLPARSGSEIGKLTNTNIF